MSLCGEPSMTIEVNRATQETQGESFRTLNKGVRDAIATHAIPG